MAVLELYNNKRKYRKIKNVRFLQCSLSILIRSLGRTVDCQPYDRLNLRASGRWVSQVRGKQKSQVEANQTCRKLFRFNYAKGRCQRTCRNVSPLWMHSKWNHVTDLPRPQIKHRPHSHQQLPTLQVAYNFSVVIINLS